ncbi:DUF3017 domain-containing protein [Streptomyces flaveus]|uniref:Membrane protein n=1 Tax=Streptomyces flaveus TaxID=66370 RepID=A0A917QTZ7_9ACTN|nr:DUF3017 domain-containing protein [Streptomyces flaveus]GGK67589.1 membrane protein [Streptomyces flaveus]
MSAEDTTENRAAAGSPEATRADGGEAGSGSAEAAKTSADRPQGEEPDAEPSQAAEPDAEPSQPGAPGPAEAPGAVPREGEIVTRDAVSTVGPDGQPQRTTRRFPRVTRDTARPEGGGRAAPVDAPAPARQWPMLTVAGTVGLGLLLTAFDVFRYGTLLIGVALLAAGVLRWALPGVGMLAVRSRFTDLVTYGVLGVTIVLLALMVQPSPLLEIPFLEDILHFTVR